MKGQAKKDLEKWLFEKNILSDFCVKYQIPIIHFNDLPPSMQYGVIVDWFDSVGIDLDDVILAYNLDEYTRPQARQKAIEKATEIYNNKNK